jgi:MoaA/NifB/PqqE/SkfB family radical SAM enzyme
MASSKEDLSDNDKLTMRYQYRAPYIEDMALFEKEVLSKTIIPKQVEIQPGPLGKKICWLDCPFCYGKSATDIGERLPIDRYVQVLNDIAAGGCRKIIVAGWATDPLNYKYIDKLVATITKNNMIVGFNTRAIRMSESLLQLLSSPSLAPGSYFSVSVDSGSNKTYNRVHGVDRGSKYLYDRVLSHINELIKRKTTSRAPLDVSAAYLINDFSCQTADVVSFIDDFKKAGCNLLRFSFPQMPRGDKKNNAIPSLERSRKLIHELRPIINDYDEPNSRVILIEPGEFTHARTLPCVARFVYPTIGFDGWLYHCSQSAGPNFRSMALGNLSERSFWDVYYDYCFNDKKEYFDGCSKEMVKNSCRCDRKEHTVNKEIGTRIYPLKSISR